MPNFRTLSKNKSTCYKVFSLSCTGILEASMHTLQEGQSLLSRIREMGMHADVQNRHATTAACYGIEHLLELLQVNITIIY